jgi:hypothetical protein
MTFAAGPNWSHRSGQGWVTTWTPDMVVAAPDPLIGFANYIEQVLGVGFPTKKDLLILRARVNELFERYPQATFHTMCNVVRFNKSEKRKFARVYTVVDSFREAMMEGWLPELSRAPQTLEQRITRILEIETDPRWRARILCCLDDGSRLHVLEQWEASHAA